jgi:hypothetical protein
MWAARTGILVLIAAGVVACGKPEDDSRKTAASWHCTSAEVPMGEVVRCTQTALTMDGPVTTDPMDGIAEACSGSTDNSDVCLELDRVLSGDGTGGTTYDCTAGDVGCPPADGSTTTGGAGGATSSDGTQSDMGTSSPPTGGTSSGGDTKPGNGNGGGHGNGPNSSDFGTSQPDECAYVPDLPYCSSSSGSSDTTSGTSDESSCDKKNCTAPGQQKKNDGSSSSGTPSDSTSSGSPTASSSSGGSSSGGSKTGKHYRCATDKKGNKVCESVPECAPGTHPSPCGACVPDGDSCDCVPPSAGGCWVTGGGFIVGPNVTTGAAPDGHDNFGGNAKPMKDGRVQGHWNHVDHGTGNHAKGKPEYIVCRHVDEPGPGQPGGKKGFTMNQVYFGGPAEWRSNGTWASGYWFDVVAKDHGEPGSVPHVKNGFMPDTYHFSIRLMDDPAKKVSGAVVYETKGVLEGGNIQMHPPNGGHPYTPAALPSWVAFEP